MALNHCPDCGAQVSESAVVCPQCGFPLRRDALTRPAGLRGGGGSTTNTAGMVIGGVVVVGIVGMVGVVVIGILAAIAIPRFTQASGRTKDTEGETLLGRLYDAEYEYFAENGRYTADLGALAAGWQPDSARHYDLEVRLGDTPRTLVCLEARPKRADVQPMSMDSMAVSYRNAGCTGETMIEFRSRGDVVLPPEELPGEGGDAGARTLLREVYPGLVEYRVEHGGDPARLGDVLSHVHDSPASAQYRLSMNRHGGLCVSAVPASAADRDVMHAFSLDGDGRMYAGGACRGTPLEQVKAALPDSAAAGS